MASNTSGLDGLGIIDLGVADHHLRLGGPAPGLGAVTLGLADELAVIDAGGLGQDDPRQDQPLPPDPARRIS